MDIRLRPINLDNLEDATCLAKWYNDDRIRHLFTVDFKKGPMMPSEPDRIREAKVNQTSLHTYMIEADGVVIGDASVDTHFENLLGSPDQAGWLGICIGEMDYQGKGIGYKVMAMLEDICKEMGLERLELGVFAYNTRAMHLYEKIGYERIATVENFTWYDGEWHDDHRMEKYIDGLI